MTHPRQERPVAAESALAENGGRFTAPTFDASGALLAVYDSGSDLVRILRGSDLTTVQNLKPRGRPRRLSFSPQGRFLVIEAHPGYDDRSSNRTRISASHTDIDSPEAIRDDIQRVDVWDRQTGQTIPALRCDAEATIPPRSGWFRARHRVIAPGYRSAALLEARFSADDEEFSVLCWDGVQQRWESRTWARLPNIPMPPPWGAWMASISANQPYTVPYYFTNNPASRSPDGRVIALSVRERKFGYGTAYVWDRAAGRATRVPGECGSLVVPDYALSRDGGRIAVVCADWLGAVIRVWDLGLGRELPLEGAGFSGGDTRNIHGGGVSLSPDGRRLAVALQREWLTILYSGSALRWDLQVWNVDKGNEALTVSIDDLMAGHVDLAVSPDSETLVVCGRKLRVCRMRDLEAGLK